MLALVHDHRVDDLKRIALASTSDVLWRQDNFDRKKRIVAEVFMKNALDEMLERLSSKVQLVSAEARQ